MKRVFPFTRPMRGVLGEGARRGGPQRVGPSWRSWQMSLPPLQMRIHPTLPTRSKVNDWEIKRPAILDSGEEMAVIGQRCAQAKPSKEHHTPTGRIGADTCDTEHRLETSQGAGESRETNTEQDMRNARARTKGGKKTQGGQKKKCRKK